MKTFFKIVSVFVLLLAIAVAGFVYTFDANKYKDEIIDLAEAATGRKVDIAGRIDVSVYPWIGIKLNNVAIANPDQFGDAAFATIDQFDVKIKIAPLLKKRLVVDALVLHRLAVDLVTNESGEDNWSDVAGVISGDGAGPGSGLAGIDIGEVAVEDSRLSWTDGTTGRRLKVSKLRMVSEAVARGEPLPVDLKAYIESSQPPWQAAVKAKTALGFDHESDVPVFDANKLKLTVKALLPESQLDTLTFAMVTDSTIDLQTQTIRLTNTKLGTLGLVMGGEFDIENMFTAPVIQGPLKVKPFAAAKLAKKLNRALPRMADDHALTRISLTAAFKTDFNTLQFDDISAHVDDSFATGYVHIVNAPETRVRYELKADKLNLDSYRIVESAPGHQQQLPVEFIRTAALDGVVDIDELVFQEKAFEELHMVSSIENGVLSVKPLTLQADDGQLKAALRLDARQEPVLALVARLEDVSADASINLLLKDITGGENLSLEGRVDADLDIKAKGASLDKLKRSAGGTVTVNMDNVVVEGVDFDNASRTVVVDYSQRNDFRVSRKFVSEYNPGHRTTFNSLNASFKLARGRVVNNDLSLVSDQVNVTGSGNIDFTNGKLDYRPVIDMNVRNTANIRDKLRDHPMEYHARGSFGELTTELDVEKYDLWVGRLLIQEAKAHKNRRLNSQENAWKNALSK